VQKVVLDHNYYLGSSNKCHKLKLQRRTSEDMVAGYTVVEQEIMDMGGQSKSFNHKITKCSLFVWIFAPWMGSFKNKIQICVILLSRSHQKNI
jgi:hypothetical protein